MVSIVYTSRISSLSAMHGVGMYALREDYAFREVNAFKEAIMNGHLTDVNFQHYYSENILQIGLTYKLHCYKLCIKIVCNKRSSICTKFILLRNLLLRSDMVQETLAMSTSL